jgi:ubiquinone biosynthesis protein COQ4
MHSNRNRLQPGVAFKAIKRLLADPEQTQEVFTIINALSGPALQNAYVRFADTEVGRHVLRNKINLLDTLKDRDYLATLPADSLGRHYLHFVTSENLSADGLVEASEGNEETMHPDVALFAKRQRDMHDLWHTLTAYGRDTLGELCLLAFTYAQTKNRGIGFICLMGMRKLAAAYGNGVYRAAWQAYQDGKQAAWLPAQDWEMLLTLPIEEVRQRLTIREPQDYIALTDNYLPA